MIILLALLSQLPQTTDSSFEKLRPKLVEYNLPTVFVMGSSVHHVDYNVAGSLDRFGNANKEFPWVHPLGTDNCTNVHTRTYHYFPEGRKIRIWYKQSYFSNESPSIQWVFPVGTVFVEVFYQTHGNDVYPWLMLVREKDRSGEWVPSAYSPIPTESELVAYGVKPTHVRELTLRHTNLVDSTKKVAIVPSMPEVQVRAFLSRPFELVHSYFDNTSFVGTSDSNFSIVPKGFKGGAVDLDTQSCMQCHKSTGKHAKEMDRGRKWYGNVRGSDLIFSWHPFDPSCISYNGVPKPMRFRSEVIGLLKF